MRVPSLHILMWFCITYFNEALRGLWVIYWECLQWQSVESVAAVLQLKSQITLNQHHLRAHVNLSTNNDEKRLLRKISSWWEEDIRIKLGTRTLFRKEYWYWMLPGTLWGAVTSTGCRQYSCSMSWDLCIGRPVMGSYRPGEALWQNIIPTNEGVWFVRQVPVYSQNAVNWVVNKTSNWCRMLGKTLTEKETGDEPYPWTDLTLVQFMGRGVCIHATSPTVFYELNITLAVLDENVLAWT